MALPTFCAPKVQDVQSSRSSDDSVRAGCVAPNTLQNTVPSSSDSRLGKCLCESTPSFHPAESTCQRPRSLAGSRCLSPGRISARPPFLTQPPSMVFTTGLLCSEECLDTRQRLLSETGNRQKLSCFSGHPKGGFWLSGHPRR